jgi:hypothetical protein
MVLWNVTLSIKLQLMYYSATDIWKKNSCEFCFFGEILFFGEICIQVEKNFCCVIFRSTREQSTVLGDMDEDTGNGSVYPKKWIHDQGNGHNGRE